MTVDPSDPETFTPEEPPEIAVEAPEADTAEQLTEVSPGQDAETEATADPASADEGDRAEQARVVTLDEDDYR